MSLDNDDLYTAADVYEKAMGCKDLDEGGDAVPVHRWLHVFDWAWCREVRQRGSAFVVCDAFDAALRAALLAVGEFWPDEIEVKAPPEDQGAPAAARGVI
jgi:hypothetical protein